MTHLVPVIRPVLGTPFRRDLLYRRAGAMPAFHIAPARTQTAADLITGSVLGTYNSATPAMAVGPDGLLFQPTANAPVIEYDPVTLACRGARIWGAVTNLLLNSATLSTQSRSVTAQSYTLHFTGTGTVTLSGASTAGPLVGTGTGEANRVSLTFTPTAGTLTLTVSGTVSNAQLNTGTTVAPYVPTTSTSASGTADVWSITGADFTRIYNPAEVSLFLSGQAFADGGRIYFDDGVGTSERWDLRLFNPATPSWGMRSRSSGVDDGACTISPNTNTFNVAGAITVNDMAISLNGSSAATDSSLNMPTSISRMFIGSFQGGTSIANGYIRELAIFRSRRPNSNLQAMTS